MRFPFQLSHQKQYRLFLLPYVLGTLLLVIVPALATVAVAFTNFSLMGGVRFAGVENFAAMFQSAYVRTGLKNSLIFLAMAIPLRVTAALLLALLMRENRRGFGFFRSAVYLPTVIPEVAYALIWLWIFNPIYGPLNIVLTGLGLPTPEWLTDPVMARVSIVILMSFQIGEGFVVLLAGLQTIPRSYYEAARVDGANSWQMFWSITLPLLMPWLLLLTFRDIAVSLQGTFTPAYVMTYGGPYFATTFLPLLVYEIAFDFFDFGLAAAVLLFAYLVLILLVLGVINLLDARRNANGASHA
ncbi:MAG: carbohydrate ABC transporter permease [Chloroflexota bacterium]